MRRAIILFLLVLSSVAVAWEPVKIDGSPAFSGDGRLLAFERCSGWDNGVVVWDSKTGESKPIAGVLTQIRRRDSSSFVVTGFEFAGVVYRNGKVGPIAWNMGAGIPCISRLEEEIGNPEWAHNRLRFQTRDIEWDKNRTWSFNPLTGQIALISTTKNTSRRSIVGTSSKIGSPARLYGGVAPAISPDSRTVAICAYTGNGSEMIAWNKLHEFSSWQNVYLLNRDGSGLTRLTSGGGTHPVWHPNGKGLAFVTPKGDLAWINRDGSGFTHLVKGMLVTKGLRWDPDGKSFRVVQRTKDGIAWYRIVPPSNTLRLIGKPIAVPSNIDAFLSPSGKTVIWFKRGQQMTSMKLVTGQTSKQLTFGPERGGEWYPSAAWSPDEKKLAFAVMGSLRLMDVRTGKIRQLTGPLY